MSTARCTLEQLRARWGRLSYNIRRGLTNAELARHLIVGEEVMLESMGAVERWKVEKIEGKRVDLVQEVETRCACLLTEAEVRTVRRRRLAARRILGVVS